VREFVFGIQDGLISTVGLLAGIQGATQNSAVVLLAGLTAMCAGAISMAAGSFLASKAQKEIFERELTEGARLAVEEPYLAREGLLVALHQEGLSREQSYRVVKLIQHDHGVFLRTFQEKVLGLGSAEVNKPLQAAVVMAASFVAGGMVPLLPYLALVGKAALYTSVVLGAAVLFAVGVFKGYLAAKSLLLSGLEFFFIAIGASASGYLIGLIVNQFFPSLPVSPG
jgi:VIT1/CCC1 family predicted Fe2+/Mn2+ transporter